MKKKDSTPKNNKHTKKAERSAKTTTSARSTRTGQYKKAGSSIEKAGPSGTTSSRSTQTGRFVTALPPSRPVGPVSLADDIKKGFGSDRTAPQRGAAPSPLVQSSQAPLASNLTAQRYVLRNEERIARFLQEHPYLVPLLSDAAQQIPTYFPDSPLVLEVVADPDGNTHPSLVVAVPTPLEPDEAIDRLDRFDEAWWFDMADRARGKITISLEYL